MKHKVKISWSGIIEIDDSELMDSYEADTIDQAVGNLGEWYNNGSCDILEIIQGSTDQEIHVELIASE